MSENTPAIIGWDIGGAHLKAVQLDAAGKVMAAMQVYCPLWHGMHALEYALDTILSNFQAPQHVVTMTGELADFFVDRRDGVQKISQCTQQKLVNHVQFYAASKGFIYQSLVAANTVHIASMNWFASMQFLAKHLAQALFVDIGSTTTDIALINQQQPQVKGFNDVMRMQYDELVYTGVVRTPLMAVAQKIAFNGHLVNVAAEHFATTADVYTLTGDLALHENMSDTADGADKSIVASARRLARMVGMDSADASIDVWRNLAYAFKSAQLEQIKQAILRQISHLDEADNLPIVGCGVGSFLAAELAKQLGFHYIPASDFIAAKDEQCKAMAALCFPAFAVASLGLNV